MSNNTQYELPANWQPTAASVNELPEPLRRYIHDLEARSDPAGDQVSLWCLRDQVRDLSLLVKKEKDESTAFRAEVECLRNAIITHRSQKADDRCVDDDDRLYESVGDGIKCDRQVGDKAAMLHNCQRFIDRRCEGGGWPTYAELEAEIERLRGMLSPEVSLMEAAMSMHRVATAARDASRDGKGEAK